MATLKMFYEDDDIIVTPTRYPKSISQVAENVTVISADEINAINAHTLADILNYVTGLQLSDQGSPGSAPNTMIQGSQPWHVLLLIDGVAQNNLAESTPDVGLVPVQSIQRVEIIKGPASSSWGSSLGGVINVITKSPDESRKFGGMVSASIGERNTGDYRLELSGKKGAFGYYLAGGGLLTDGLLSHNGYHGGNFYTKLVYSPNDKANITFTLGYIQGARQVGTFPSFGINIDSDVENLFSTLALDYKLSSELSLNVSLRSIWRDIALSQQDLFTGRQLDIKTNDDEFGCSAKLIWTQQQHEMAVGFDFDSGRLESLSIKDGKQGLDKWALYANDSLTFGKLSVTPGLRFDHTSTNGEFWSPSLGVTFTPLENTILRAYVARGFNTPSLASTFGDGIFVVSNPGLKMEKTWSYSAGFETTFLRYFWLKTTLFRHDISDVLDTTPLPDGTFMWVNAGKQRRQGVEAELKTMPLFNTSLTAGYALLDTVDRLTGADVPNVPHYTWDMGLQYDDKKSFRATLKGHYIRWDMNSPDNTSRSSLIWDLYLSKKILTTEHQEVEAFFSAHNIFNGAQYFREIFPNPGRWFEGGIRYSF